MAEIGAQLSVAMQAWLMNVLCIMHMRVIALQNFQLLAELW